MVQTGWASSNAEDPKDDSGEPQLPKFPAQAAPTQAAKPKTSMSHCSFQAPIGTTKNRNSTVTEPHRPQVAAVARNPWPRARPRRGMPDPTTSLSIPHQPASSLREGGQRDLREDDPSDDGDGEEHREELDRRGRHGHPPPRAPAGSASRRPDPVRRGRRHGLPLEP
jgi:hypothetical protein